MNFLRNLFCSKRYSSRSYSFTQVPAKLLDLQKRGMNSQKIQRFTLGGTETYAYVSDVHDGDSIKIVTEYNGKLTEFTCRCAGYNSAEIRTKNLEEKKLGNASKKFVSDALLHHIVWVKFSEEDDKYGRFLIHIWLERGDKEEFRDIVIAHGFGKAYDGKGKKEY